MRNAIVVKEIFCTVMLFLCSGGLPMTSASEPFSFIVYGDSRAGSDCSGNMYHLQLIARMNNEPVAMVFHVGDMVIGTATTTNWAQNGSCIGTDNYGSFKDQIAPFLTKAPRPGLPTLFFPAIGNHDDAWGGGYPDMLNGGICDAFASGLLKTLIPNHTQKEYFRDKSGVALKVYSDTEFYSRLCSKDAAQSEVYPAYFYYSFDFQNSHFIIMRVDTDTYNLITCSTCSQDDYANNPQIHQLHWLEYDLTKAKTNPLIENIFVFLHAPVFTSSSGHPANASWQILSQEFSRYRVKMAFSGHIHAYERTIPIYTTAENPQGLRDDGRGTMYVATGGGGAPSHGFNAAQWFDAVQDTRKQYVKISVNGTHIFGQTIGIAGELIDTFDLYACGDVSGDGKVSSYDAALASQFAVSLITLTPGQVRRSDVSGGGGVSAYDAALIAQRTVGLITKFPVEN